ncbi:cytochrome P450 [Nocardia terpenica]|nr:cytochrome P450 [Nocardia terpenica]MBF6107155.1 cytochrome P450 [Nocardia terpenica]MBF6114328.1 cytochrome P450 [Nocardia terpenica]MBF6121585.1 cytochrome P450 [Nocardia terpenica]MBF6154000.1 cytochrome P450 [Nocardia terpenica]
MLPHPRGRLPFLGDIASVDRHRTTQNELRLAQGGLGPIFQRKVLRNRVVIVSGARLAAECCDETSWARCLAGPVKMLREIVPEGLFTARTSNPLWGQARRILTPGFSQAAMRVYHEAMSSVADDLVAEWSAAEGGVVDVHDSMTAATLEMIGRAGFSRRLGLLGAGDVDGGDSRRFAEAFAEILGWVSGRANDLPVIGTVRTRLRARHIQTQVIAIRRYVDRVVSDRRQQDAGDLDDLLDLMLTTSDPETGEFLPAANVRDQVLTFLMAGHETTAAVLETALHYLAAAPDLQDELRAEIQAQGGFDYEAVIRMRRIRNVLNEVLRLWPPVSGFFRVARTDQVLGGYKIPAGQSVLVLSLAAHRDTEAWGPQADLFDPDRFEADRSREFPNRFFHPFGTGPRSCIGRAFALHEATLLLARILDTYTLNGVTPLRMYERGTLRPEPFTLTARHRHQP